MTISQCTDEFAQIVATSATNAVRNRMWYRLTPDYGIRSLNFFQGELFMTYSAGIENGIIETPTLLFSSNVLTDWSEKLYLYPLSVYKYPFSYSGFSNFINRIKYRDFLVTISLKNQQYFACPWLMLNKNKRTLYYATTTYSAENGKKLYTTAYISAYVFTSNDPLEKNFVKHIIPSFIKTGIRVKIGIPQSVIFSTASFDTVALASKESQQDLNEMVNKTLQSCADKWCHTDSLGNKYVDFSTINEMESANSFRAAAEMLGLGS